MSSASLVVAIRDFIAYSPSVPVVRKILMGCGGMMIVIAVMYGLAAWFLKRRVAVIVSDITALKCFLAALFLIPLICFMLAATASCDFWPFQFSASLMLFMVGSLVAIRTRRHRYIFYYFMQLLLLGGLAPPS